VKVLLLGGTGFVGAAVLSELCRAGHRVIALARSDDAAGRLSAPGAEPLRGDLRRPDRWAAVVTEVDAVVHVAATFSPDMGAVDGAVLQSLTGECQRALHRVRFIYTGGVWLYGATGDTIASEQTPFNPIPGFEWMVSNGASILNSPCFSANVIHPGMCYVRDGGSFSRFARRDRPVEIWGSADTRWPVVHREDLARAYRLVLEQAPPGESYNVCAQIGVRVGDLATATSRRLGLAARPVIRSVADVVAEHGQLALGPTLDQQMSSEKITRQLGWVPVHTDAVAEQSACS
jgi:nucleoside-diphosphate-sugar epimerase